MELVKYQLTDKQKTKERAIEMIEHFVPDFTGSMSWVWKEYEQDLANYKLYNNQLDPEEFKQYCDPLGLGGLAFENKIKPFNIGSKNIDVLLGEELKRNDRFSAVLIGEGGSKQKSLELQQLYEASVQAEIERLIVREQVKLQQMEPQQAEEYLKYLESFVRPEDIEVGDFQSESEILVNKIINYAYFSEKLAKQKNDGFFHSLISGREVVYVGMNNGKPCIRVENPLFVFFEKSPDTQMIQDGNWAGKLSAMTIFDVLNEYGDDLTKEEIERLESQVRGASEGTTWGKTMEYNRRGTLTNRFANQFSSFSTKQELEDGLGGVSRKANSSYDSNLVEVVHLEWKWFRKVGFLEYTDEYGETQITFVDEDFPVPTNAVKFKKTNNYGKQVVTYQWQDPEMGYRSIEYMMIPEVWEITRIDGDIFTRFRKVQNQYISIDNPFEQKLSYHGTRYSAVNAKSISPMGRQKPYIFLYILIMYQIGELISRNYGPIANIDTSQIDTNLGKADGLDPVQTTLTYLTKGWNFYNSLNNTQGGGAIASRPQPGSVSNMSTTVDLNNMLNILQWLDLEAGMSIGISPQRKAMFSNNSNVTDNQQSITQSSHITEKLFFVHNELWSDVISTYVNIFKRWAKQRLMDNRSIELNYILPNKSKEVLKISHVDFEQINVFPTYSSSDDEYIREMRELALVFAQNDANIEDISNILLARARGTSPEEVHKMITISSRKREAIAQQQDQRNTEIRAEIAQMNNEAKEDMQAHEIEKIRVKGEEDRKLEEIKNKTKK